MHFYVMSIVVDAPFNIISKIWKHFLHHVYCGYYSLYYYQILIWKHFYTMSIEVDALFIIIKIDWKHFYPMSIMVDAPFIIIKFD